MDPVNALKDEPVGSDDRGALGDLNEAKDQLDDGEHRPRAMVMTALHCRANIHPRDLFSEFWGVRCPARQSRYPLHFCLSWQVSLNPPRK